MQHMGSRSSFRSWARQLLQLGLGLAVLTMVLYLSGLDNLHQLTKLKLLPLLGGFGATLGIAVSIALRWHILTGVLLGRPATEWFRLCQYFLWNRLLGFIVPKDLSDIGGRTASLVIQHDVPLRHAGTSVLMDRAFDILVMGLFLSPSLLFLSNTTGVGVGGALIVIVACGFYLVCRLAYHSLAAKMVGLYNLLAGITYHVPLLRRRPLKRVESFPLSMHHFSKAYLLSLSKFLCTALRLIFFGSALDMPISPLAFFVSAPVGQLSFLLAFTPGGLGIFEAGWYAVLARVGVPHPYIAPFLVEQRVFTILFIGTLALLSKLLTTLFPLAPKAESQDVAP